MQFLLGVHPNQVMAAQALSAAANGGAQPASSDVPPPDVVAPKPRAISASNPSPDAAPAEIAPKPSLIPRPGPRALDVPPVGSPGPVEGTVATGTEDSAGRPMLAKAGPEALPVGAVPAAAPQPPPTEKPVDMSSMRSLMTTPIRPISGDQARENTDRTELDRLRSTGSGVDQFMHRHRFLGPLVKGLSIAGSVLAPGPASMIPGTDLHHQVLEHQAEGRVVQDIGAEKAHSQMATAEEAQQAREEANRTREQGLKDKVSEANAKFIAGSEKEDPNSPTGYTAQTIGGEWKPYTPPQSYRESKSETSQAEFKQRQARAKELNLTGEDEKYFLANGKLREPNPNQPQLDEDRKARIQRQREHDQDTRMQHYQNDHARWAEHKSAIEKEQEQGYAKIENDWRKKYGEVLDGKDTDPQKQAAMADLDRQKKLLENSAATRFKELGPEPQQPQIQASPAEGPVSAVAPADSSPIEQPIASVRAPGPAPIGGQVQTAPSAPQKQEKPSPSTQQNPPTGAPKSASRDEIQAYANARKIPYQQAEEALKKAGYTVR